jgi:hypothetical protein
MRLFDQILEGASYYFAGTTSSFPSYSVQESANHKINISLPVTWTISTSSPYSASVVLQTFVSGSTRNTLLAQDSYLFRGYPITTTLSLDSYALGYFEFNLTNPVPVDIVIASAIANGFNNPSSCNNSEASDNISFGVIPAGETNVYIYGSSPLDCNTKNYRFGNLEISGVGTKTSGSTYLLDGITTVTVNIAPGCIGPYAC